MEDPQVLTLMAGVGIPWIDGTYKISPENLPILVSQLIAAIEKLISGKNRGEYKKTILTETVHVILKETNHEDLIGYVDTILPQLIDSMVSLTNNKNKCCTIL